MQSNSFSLKRIISFFGAFVARIYCLDQRFATHVQNVNIWHTALTVITQKWCETRSQFPRDSDRN